MGGLPADVTAVRVRRGPGKGDALYPWRGWTCFVGTNEVVKGGWVSVSPCRGSFQIFFDDSRFWSEHRHFCAHKDVGVSHLVLGDVAALPSQRKGKPLPPGPPTLGGGVACG